QLGFLLLDEFHQTSRRYIRSEGDPELGGSSLQLLPVRVRDHGVVLVLVFLRCDLADRAEVGRHSFAELVTEFNLVTLLDIGREVLHCDILCHVGSPISPELEGEGPQEMTLSPSITKQGWSA